MSRTVPVQIPYFARHLMSFRKFCEFAPIEGRIWPAVRYLLRYKLPLTLALLATVATVLSELWFPWILRFLIDDVLSGKVPSELGYYVGMLAIAALCSLLFNFIHAYGFSYLALRVGVDLRTELAHEMQRLPLTYFHDRQSGDLASIFTNDVPTVAALGSSVIGQVTMSMLRLALTIVIISVLFRQAVFLVLAIIPIYAVLPLILNKPLRRCGKEVQQRRANMLAEVQESLAAIREVRAFSREDWDSARLRGVFEALFPAQLRLARFQAISLSTIAIYWGVVALIYWFGGKSVLNGRLTLGALIATVTYFGYLAQPIAALITANGRLQSARGAAERIWRFLEQTPKEEVAFVGNIHLKHCLGKVQFENVSFTYPGRSVAALSGVTFVTEPGERIALVGPSGSGKTTLVSLLLRLFDPTAGRILLDGRDLCHISRKSFHDFVSIVFQDPFLFSGTVTENIRFGDSKLSDDALIRAAHLAKAHEFIIHMSHGYKTAIGERGVKLSGGQRQRIAIARLIVRDPQIVIFDEATSAIDSGCELNMYSGLDSFLKSRTTLIIAHRLSTVLRADRIVVLEKGSVVAAGPHEKLLNECALYRSLCTSQLRGGHEVTDMQLENAAAEL